eukprot:gnl/TRDRNA2_/TRDRNA2_42565_c0_seq1.p1 gnl/TRDRNA2_/TRDRNA2_42565_c0~~gnl/TRDRNA2_/TRDRNA2_42565_c0_seq1.p1  ORF type:complete len:591 (+),score=92.00 gnl/TRDRNA2_/TRDRNA2_42565_c0_seq1:49-1821(+)
MRSITVNLLLAFGTPVPAKELTAARAADADHTGDGAPELTADDLVDTLGSPKRRPASSRLLGDLIERPLKASSLPFLDLHDTMLGKVTTSRCIICYEASWAAPGRLLRIDSACGREPHFAGTGNPLSSAAALAVATMPAKDGAKSEASVSAQEAAAESAAKVAAAAAELAGTMTISALRRALRAEGLKSKGRTKIAVAERLCRCRRAIAVLNGDDAMPHKRRERYDRTRAGQVSGKRRSACRLCRGPILAPRRTFCCDECVHFHNLRTSGRALRAALFVRDRGVCALCSIDAFAIYKGASAAVEEAIEAWKTFPQTNITKEDAARSALKQHLESTAPLFAPQARLRPLRDHWNQWGRRCPLPFKGSFWHGDHVVAVVDGGGSCGLANLRTLCVPCHANVTASQSTARAAARANTTQKVKQTRRKVLKAASSSHSSASEKIHDGDDSATQSGDLGDGANATHVTQTRFKDSTHRRRRAATKSYGSATRSSDSGDGANTTHVTKVRRKVLKATSSAKSSSEKVEDTEASSTRSSDSGDTSKTTYVKKAGSEAHNAVTATQTVTVDPTHAIHSDDEEWFNLPLAERLACKMCS